MPLRLLFAFARALPRLEAEEELRAVRAMSAPYMRETDRRRYLRQLEDLVRPRATGQGLTGSRALREWLAAWGFAVG